ncbi:hypothetical protein NIES2101_31220 [Calothrix sp. HK-06]|nr:hypothetical protein NIES2101_31220 [Calothrix sp. HK-06]
MKLSGEQRKKLHSALLDAFCSKANLEQMLWFELDKNLDAFAGGDNLQNIVFQIIKLAESEGWVEDLVCAARHFNSGNSNLKIIAEELLPQIVTNLNQSIVDIDISQSSLSTVTFTLIYTETGGEYLVKELKR